jgi:hypothetical protein
MPGMCVFVFILLFLHLPIPSQNTASQQKDPSYDLWLVRSQTLTDELIKDGANLEPSQRSMLLARLAQRWWRDNPEKAKSWMADAIAAVEAVPNKENPEDRRKRISTARQLLQIVAPLDQKFTARLVELLKDADKHAVNEERAANAEGILDAAFSLIDSDPIRASELGAAALRIDHSSNIYSLILSLRQKNAKIGDALLAQALALGRQTLESQLLLNLTRASYPAELQVVTKAPPPAKTLRAELLQIDVAYLQANPINSDTQHSVCAAVVTFIVPLLAEFDRRLPQLTPAVRQAVNQCQSLSPLSQQRIDDAFRPEPFNSVDDLLKAAEDSQDIKVKTVYKYRAATLAKEKKDYDRALAILDGMSVEEQGFMGPMWQYSRWDWASLSAIEHYNRDDFSAMRNTIAAVPDDLKAFAKLAFVDRLPNKQKKEADPTLEFLIDARKQLASSYGSEVDRYPWYFALLRLTFKYAPEDSPAILKEAIAALNRAEQADGNEGRNAEARYKETAGVWKNLPVSLIDMDEYALKEAISSISSNETRTAVRLALLQAFLERMRSAKEPSPNSRRTAAKGE